MVTIGRNSMLLALCNSIHNTQHCEWKCYFPSDTQIHFPELPPSAHIPSDFPFIVFALCLYAHYSDDLCVCTRYGLVFRMLYFYTFVHSFRSLILSCSVSSEFSSLCSMHVLRHSGCACASPPSMCVRVCVCVHFVCEKSSWFLAIFSWKFLGLLQYPRQIFEWSTRNHPQHTTFNFIVCVCSVWNSSSSSCEPTERTEYQQHRNGRNAQKSSSSRQ